jgi:hypothetical protein
MFRHNWNQSLISLYNKLTDYKMKEIKLTITILRNYFLFQNNVGVV